MSEFFPALAQITMTARGWASVIVTRLQQGGLELPLQDADGFTVQDILTVAIERAIKDGYRSAQVQQGYSAEPPPDPQAQLAGVPVRDDGKLA